MLKIVTLFLIGMAVLAMFGKMVVNTLASTTLTK